MYVKQSNNEQLYSSQNLKPKPGSQKSKVIKEVEEEQKMETPKKIKKKRKSEFFFKMFKTVVFNQM